MRIAVIADDLTGAADTGAALVRAGHRTAVAVRGERVDADAVVIDTDSRGLPAAEAAARVRAVDLAGAEIVMKKVDSTLRGPLAAEVEAALAASGRTRAIVAPAFPATGRTTVGGVQHLDGVPVHETRFAHDPVSPVHESDIARLLTGAGGAPVVRRVPAGESSPAAFAAGDVVVCDAETDEDLEAIVRSVEEPSSVLWVGSAGLAAALGAVYPGPGVDEPEEDGPGGRVLVVVGSANATAREQIARVCAPAVAMPLDGRDVSAPVIDALHRARACVLHPAEGEGDPRTIAAGLAEVAARAGAHITGLVLTGGDTAVHVARRLGATGLLVEDELEPGVVFGRLIGPHPFRIVTKAGGFGSPDALRRATAALAAGGRTRA